uniref:F5/8 type C domain-containing protein n=1 Tax=viral metagenome TaxID=1070528 RepID=A0A6C0HU01_9ZZZZ
MSTCSSGTSGCPQLTKFLPFSNNTVFTDNSINIVSPINNVVNSVGSYIITSSSYFDNTTQAFNAFNNDNTFWKSNTSENYFYYPNVNVKDQSKYKYTTTPYSVSNNIDTSIKSISNYQGGSYPSQFQQYYFQTLIHSKTTQIKPIDGEWLQIQLPNPIILASYSISTPLDDNLHYFPAKFTVVGSNDGSNWTIVDSSDNTTVSISDVPRITPTNTSITFSIKNNSNKYSYYRLILEAMQNNVSCVRITQWSLIGTIPVESFVGSINNQYSYQNIYPSLNTFSNFAISESMISLEKSKDSINNHYYDDKDYNKIYAGILFSILGGALVYIFLKSKK